MIGGLISNALSAGTGNGLITSALCMPVYKQPTYRLYIYIKAMAYRADTDEYYLGNNANAMLVIVNVKNNKSYRTAYTTSRHTLLLPAGEYKVKAITATGNYGSYVDDIYYSFIVDSNGKVSLPKPTKNFSLSGSVITMGLPISVWKFRIYYDKQADNPVLFDKPRKGTARPDKVHGVVGANGSYESLWYPDLSEISSSVSVNVSGAMLCDVWLDGENIVNGIPFAQYYYNNDVAECNYSIHMPGTASNISVTTISKLPVVNGSVSIETKGFCGLSIEANDYSYTAKLSLSYNRIVNTKTWRIYPSFIFFPTHFGSVGIEDMIPSDEKKYNYGYDAVIDVSVNENSFTSGFSKDDFTNNNHINYWPKKDNIENLAPSDSYVVSGRSETNMFSNGTWEFIKEHSITTNTIYGYTASQIIREIASLLVANYDFNQTEINSNYLRAHALIFGKYLEPIEQTVTGTYGGITLTRQLYNLSEAIKLTRVNSIYGSYKDMEEAILSVVGKDGTLEVDDYYGPPAEMLFSNDKIKNTKYGKTLFNSNRHLPSTYSLVQAAVAGSVQVDDQPNHGTCYVGAYTTNTYSEDYDEWMNNPNVTVLT